ncbi:hypothetical protein [Pelagibaculum spongiae]|uniref:Tle cognate immunity protein 4 C-terminal domain-containing protein n=1 Tax=Pelagibaculum spongiae TaxID=2080658 RepID=A0A2V1GWS5_9GAMM|nr:hypothetical protein [Pelagibaculum spongiae]PVZ71631.1 hypothetical protein DC094_00950 [Pelagibaculum spongiae]
MDQDKEIKFFNSYCAGRFEMKLPIGSTIISSQLESEFLHLTFNDRQTENEVGFHYGNDRVEKWEANIETKKSRREATQYISSFERGDMQMLGINRRMQESYSKNGPVNFSNVFLYKDFAELKLGVSGKEGLSRGTLYERNGTFESQYQSLIDNVLSEMNLVNHAPWPHNQLGLCLNNQLLFNRQRAYENELYAVEYKLGDMSFMRVESVAYNEGWKKMIDGQRGPFKRMLSVFSNKRVKVAGFDGYLAVALHPYHREAVKFKWLSSSPKFGTTRHPSIKIRGTININDWPQIADRGKSLDMLMTILASIQPRENGFVGTW